ncbi:hypothetical protein AS594_39140 [Streptomyces agglomeratus]|uniref:Translation elongation factor EFG/EF2 domain-containing protein n=1 Tax=Streptomyces agglomeratus TaxID=285458 RepID=A0A1E5NZ59_9ACTN|nr:hypothetical protein [Streptomyces agglomeratus]OEJ21554.1 hypothetical protein AS594_39140 [Streptomyces agglomeratus]
MEHIEAGLLPDMADSRTAALARPVRGVKVYSRQTLGACWPTYGRAELDFEPVPEGTVSSCEFACAALPEPDAELEEALVQGVMRELAGEDSSPEARRDNSVGARVIVRALSWHPVDSHPAVFVRLGALAVREALQCVAEDREPREIVTRVSLL